MLFLLLVPQTSEMLQCPLATGALPAEHVSLHKPKSEGQMLNADGEEKYFFRNPDVEILVMVGR
jgi:hypothetical protein